MELYYFKDPLGNFGDDLNPWLWEQLIPGFLDNDPAEIFVGIGTLINHKLPPQPVKHVFGSGAGYGTIPEISDKYRFHAVRGFHTASKLGVSQDRVITDSAILVATVCSSEKYSKVHSYGFMTTGETECNFNWSTICDGLGIKHISCHLPVREALDQIMSCEVMICEAMHGAIVADSLGIPWVPVRCNENISEFKWSDWLSSVKMEYIPHDLPKLYSDDGVGVVEFYKNNIKKILKNCGVWRNHWSEPLPRRSTSREVDLAAEALRKIMLAAPQLSSGTLRKTHIERYLELIDCINGRKGGFS